MEFRLTGGYKLHRTFINLFRIYFFLNSVVPLVLIPAESYKNFTGSAMP